MLLQAAHWDADNVNWGSFAGMRPLHSHLEQDLPCAHGCDALNKQLLLGSRAPQLLLVCCLPGTRYREKPSAVLSVYPLGQSASAKNVNISIANLYPWCSG